MEISRLTKATESSLTDINSLLKQLVHDPASYSPISIDVLERIVADNRSVIMTAQEGGKIVGVGILYVIVKPRGQYAYVEDMMVDEAYRGKGIGESIGRKLIEAARERGATTIELSARPSRVAANELYKKLGFKQKDTNVYRLKL